MGHYLLTRPEGTRTNSAWHSLQVQVAPTAAEAVIGSLAAHSQIQPTWRAGFPTTVAYSGTSRITTDPAPTSANLPMVLPHTITALAPIVEFAFTKVGRSVSGPFLI